MAIDTKAKRMSMLSFASPLAWGHHFEVDGAVDADDRAHLLHLYGGIAAAVANTLNLRIRIGGVPVVVSGAVAVPSGASNVPWRIEGLYTVRSLGAGGSGIATGSYDNGQSAGLIASALASSLDTTIDNDVEVTGQWGTASVLNSVTVQQLVFEMAD